MRCLRNVAAGLACGLAVLVSSLSPAAGQSLTWTGAVSNAWDIQTTQNWLNSSGTQTYSDGSDVTFGDGTANPSIAITAGGVSPASVTFTNNTTPYTFSGGPINDVTGGTTAVTLNGSGSVTFSGTNTYTGGTTINAGSLVAASPGAVGTGPIVLSGGVLQVNGTPLGLAHRWSFNNSLADSVGGSSATVFGSTTLSANQVTLTSAGGHQDAYVSLGTNILPTTNSPVTIELWATQNAVQNWSRIFDFGNGTGNNILMAWTGGTTITNDQLRYQAANGANSQENNQLAPYTLGTEYHIAVVITPYTDPTAGASTTFTAYKMDALGNVLNTATFNDPGASLAGLVQTNMWLGLSEYGADSSASASYNEFRIWDTALTQQQLLANSLAGPDANLNGLYNNAISVTAPSGISVSNGLATFPSIALGSALHVSGSNAVMTFNSTSVSGTGTLNVDAGMSVLLPAVGDNGTAATFVKTGAGPVVLTGTNTFTAGTAFQVNVGSLVAVGQSYTSPGPASGPLGSAPIILGGGGLVLAAATTDALTLTFDLVSGNAVTLAGSGGSIIAGMGSAASGAVANGTVTLAGSSAFLIGAGQTLSLGSSNGYVLNIDPGLAFSNSGTLSIGPGSVTLQASNLALAGTLSAASGGTLTMAGPISTGVYAPAATGTVVLSGAYSGSLANLAPAAGGTLVIANNISAGTLNVAGGAYAATSPASFGPTTLQLNGGTLAAATALTGGNAIANSLVFTTTGSKTLNFGGSSNLELSGSLNLSSGTYNLNDPAGVGTLSGVISGGGTLNITGNPTLTAFNTYTGKTILNSNTDVTIGNNRAFGTGTITFSSSSSDGFQAGTPLIGGNAIANPWAIAKNDAAWFNGANAIQLSGSSSLPSGTESLELTNPGLTVVLSGSISGGGSLLRSSGSAGQVNGTLIINNPANTFSGGFTLQSLGGYVDVQGASTTVSLGTITKGPLGTGAITIGSSNTGYIGLLNSSPLAVTLANALTIDDGCYYMSSSGLTFSGHVTLGGTSPMINFLLGTNDNIAFTGTIIGGDGINLRQGYGGGGLKLSGTASTYSGATSITMGTLIAGGNAFSGANGVFGDATSAITIGDANSGGNPAALVTGGAYTIGRPITVNATAGPTTLGTIGGGTSTYSGAILVNSSSVALSAVPGSSVLFTGNISGSGGITASSPGNGNVGLMGTNSYTGATTVAGGQLTLDYSGLTASAGTVGGIVPPASPVVLSGGTLAFAGNASAAVNETFVSTGVAGFGSTVVVSGSGTGVKVNLGPLSRSGGVLDLAASAGVFSTSSSNTSGILGGYLTVNGYTDWASVSSSGTIDGLSANGGYNTNDFSNPGNNVDVTGAVSPPAGAVTVNSLRFNSGSVNLSLNGPLTLASGGILVTPSGGSSGISGGALTSSSGTTAANSLADVVVIQGNTAAPFTISSPITDNGGTPVGLTKGGPGALLLTGSNTFTGPISVSGGTLQMGTGQPGQDTLLNGNIANNGAVVLNINANQTYGGTISGGGSLTKGGSGTLTLLNVSTYGGPTTISGGTLKLQLGGAFAPPDTGDLKLWLDASDLSTLQLNGSQVEQWKDKSGAGNNAVAINSGNAPNYLASGLGGTQPTISINGTPGFLSSFNLNDPNVTVAVIYQNMGGANNASLFGHDSGGGWHRLQLVATGNGPNSYGAGGYNVAVPGMDSANVNSYILVSQAGVSNGASIYLNGALAAGPFTDNNPNGTNNMAIGNIDGSGGWAGNVDISAVLVYDTALSSTQVTALNAYMNAWIAGKRGGINLLPITTPLTLGANASFDLSGCTQQVASLAGGGSVINSNSGSSSLLTFSPSGGSTTFSGTIDGTQGPISLAMNGNGTQLLAGSLLGSGSLTVNSGALVLGASNSLLGVTTLAGGTLQLNNSQALADQTLTLSATAGVLNTTGLTSLTLGGLAGAGNLAAPAGPLTIGGNGMTTTYAGNLSGATSLTKVGSGSLYLSGSNSVGNTLVSAGAIEAELAASLSGSVSVAGGAGFILPTGNGATGWTGSQIGALLVSSSWANNSSLLTIDTTNASATIAASIIQPLALNIVGGNTLTLGAANTYSGPTTITGGALNLAHNLAVQNSTVTVSSSGALTFAAGITSPTLGGLAGSASLALATAASQPVTLSVGQNGQNTTYTGVLSGAGGLTKVGAGTLTLTTSQAYGGATLISGGILCLAGANPALAHRWSFNNSLADSVGGSSATVFGSTTLSANQVTLNSAGGHQDAYVSLGTNILPTTNSPVTIELWATQNAVQNWSRIFDFGNGTGNNILMAWTGGTTITNDQLRYQAANGANNQENNQLAPYTLGTEYHIAVVITPYTDPTAGASTTFTAYKMDALGNVLNTATFNDPGASLAGLVQTNMWLGLSEYGADSSASASYNEFRIWDTALTQQQLSANSLAGPDAFLGGNNLLPTTSPLTIAAAGTLDLGGAYQQLASFSGGGSVINSNTGSASVLTLSPSGGSTTFSGMIQGGGTLGTISLVLDGPGTMVLSGTNTYTGGTTVWNGTLQLNNSAALADGSSLSVGNNLGVFGLTPAVAVATPGATAAVPEPAALALLGVAGIVAAAAAWRRSRNPGRPEPPEDFGDD